MTYATVESTASRQATKVNTTTETLNTKKALLLAISRGHTPATRQPVTVTPVTKQPETKATQEPETMPLPVSVATKARRSELVGCKFTKQQKQLILDYMAEKGFTNINSEPDMTAYLTDHFRKVVPGFNGAE